MEALRVLAHRLSFESVLYFGFNHISPLFGSQVGEIGQRAVESSLWTTQKLSVLESSSYPSPREESSVSEVSQDGRRLEEFVLTGWLQSVLWLLPP